MSAVCVEYSYTSTINWYRREYADVTLQQNLEKYIHHWSGYVKRMRECTLSKMTMDMRAKGTVGFSYPQVKVGM